ncbi:serine hydrolase domain-containing protein [Algoriphagus antarcticus]|uniref:CubicO group peptidase (Beta-lactamase class C family) n=1 Tax=Algoriphagus antarcticus TaxID=238540 RepID=A0A3E0DWI3_9BACT|nr:serine hydrolase domain-containing protein [Algoriphagus antarcticus]REG90315.1 CubicO group peptidase (beta-lactamase class C family) [Algoriphagus antarcticus]
MSKKIKILFVVLVFWLALFITWEWWHSFPKVRFNPSIKVSSKKEGIDSILTQAMSSYLLPGVSVAIVEEGKVSYLNAFGYENLKTKDSLTVESQILVASVSKLFTALGVASAFQDKEIISQDYVSSLGLGKKVNSSSLANLRLKDLLSHQSGVRDKNFSEMIFSFSKFQSLNEWGVEFLEKGNKYQTDSITYNYADSNYDLLGFLLSQSDNLDFDSLIQRDVLTPSGMVNSKFLSSWPVEENGITGYQKTFLWKRLEPKRISFQVYPSPSSGLLTTTRDMSLAMVHLLRGEMGVYQNALYWLTIGGSDVPLGFQKVQINGSEWIGHFGGQAGYSSLLFYSKEAETGIFLFANARDKEDFRISIASQIISYISP